MPKGKAVKSLLTEGLLPQISAERVDRDKGVIHGVRMGGLISRNRREYTTAAYKEAIKAGLYEGKPCNVNHVEEGKQVSANDRFGIWRNVRWSDTPEPGPVGNLHYIKSHPMADRVCESAERPDLAGTFGMSHIADASKVSYREAGKVIIEGIESVKSVDLVADPATVNGLFEHTETPHMAKSSIDTLIESSLNFPFQKKLYEGFKGNDVTGKYLKEEIEIEEGTSPADSLNTAFTQLSVSIAADNTLAPEAKGKWVTEAATLQAKLLNGPEVEPVKVTETVAPKTIDIDKAFKLCEQLEFAPDQKQLKTLLKLDEATAKEVAESFASVAVKHKKASSAPRLPIQESTTTEQKPASSTEELAQRIRN